MAIQNVRLSKIKFGPRPRTSRRGGSPQFFKPYLFKAPTPLPNPRSGSSGISHVQLVVPQNVLRDLPMGKDHTYLLEVGAPPHGNIWRIREGEGGVRSKGQNQSGLRFGVTSLVERSHFPEGEHVELDYVWEAGMLHLEIPPVYLVERKEEAA